MLNVRIRHETTEHKRRYGITETRLASLVHFRPGVSEMDIERALRSIAHVLDGDTVDVREYAPEHGSPVFYIP